MQSGRSRWLLLALFLAAFGLRLYRLDAQSLWWDEGISLHLATSSLAEIAANRVINIHPPLYFFALKGWTALTGLTPFAARYSSVLASFLQVAAVYAFSRRWFGRIPAVWLAAGLVALSPLSVIYGQEVRVYAFLPLIYLALLAITRQLARSPGETARTSPPFQQVIVVRNLPAGGSIGRWLALGFVEWAGLHLHYTAVFIVAYVAGWALLAFYRQRRWADLRRWLTVQILVSVASLPWFLAVAANWTAVQAEANAGTFITEPVSLGFLIAQVWTFHLTGLAGALSRPVVRWLAALAALGLAGLLFLRWRQWRTALLLLVQWLLPLSLALVLWSVRSFSHPRYVSIFAIGLAPFAAYLLAPTCSRSRLSFFLPLLLGLPLVWTSLWGLQAYFFDPRVAKDDMRGVAHYLETAAAPDDLIIIPDAGWALQFEYQGDTEIGMPELTDREEMWGRLNQWTGQYRRIFVLIPTSGSRDWQNVLPYALEGAGSLVDIEKFDGLNVHQYLIDRSIARPDLTAVSANFGPLKLVGVQVENGVSADSALTLALEWQVVAAPPPHTQADVRLLDVDGWPLAHASRMLVDAHGWPADQWSPGQSITTYHILPIPPGTPPLTYRVDLSLFALGQNGEQQPFDLLDTVGAPQGQRLRLADAVQIAPASSHSGNPYGIKDGLSPLPDPLPVVPGLALVAAGFNRERVAPGQSLVVSLKWQTSSAPLPDLRPQLLLIQSGRDLAISSEAPALGRYPTDRWPAGEQVLEHRQLFIPPEAETGLAAVVVSLGDARQALGTVEIVVEDYLFTLPPIPDPLDVRLGDTVRLAGFDLAVEEISTAGEEISTADPVPLTLYWQAMETGSDRSYAVFTHILAEDGRLIAQHDSLPVNGTRPTTGWVTGEYIIDFHALQFREPEYRGAARIEVGMYDPATGVRLTTPTGEDHIILPLTLNVSPAE